MDARAAALAAKDAGNVALADGRLDDAVAAYTAAIALEPGDHAFGSNRSAARLLGGEDPPATGLEVRVGGRRPVLGACVRRGRGEGGCWVAPGSQRQRNSEKGPVAGPPPLSEIAECPPRAPPPVAASA